MKKETNNSEKINLGAENIIIEKWFYILLIILIIFLWWDSSDRSSALEEYKTCTDSCVSDNEGCISDFSEVSNNNFEYLSLDNAEDCSSDLDFCIRDCDKS